MTTTDTTLIECPRDAWQGLPKPIPPAVKAEYLRRLIAAGFRHIDAVSFVSPKAVPQMADSEQVLRLLQPSDDVEIIGIVVNKQGADRAIATEAVRTLGFPYSVSQGFLARNQHQTPEDALDALDDIAEAAYRAGLDLVVYVSMAFGNPYGDPWNLEEALEACGLLTDIGVKTISLADTVGGATPEQVGALMAAVLKQGFPSEFGIHLHARPEDAADKILAAWRAGCRRFDTALGGLGGCPFAQDALVGNISTERALETLAGVGARLPRLKGLDNILAATAEIAREFGPSAQ